MAVTVLAGSHGPERALMRPSDDPRWYEPLHVRDPATARERLAAQVRAGADVVCAPAWQSHRRALLRVGETRRARAWTDASVRVAREGVDLAGEAAARPATDAVRLAGVVPPLAAWDDPSTGRLPARDAGLEDDLRAHIGTLAEAGVDLLLIESGDDPADARRALDAAGETGLPVWAALPETAGPAWADVVEAGGPNAVVTTAGATAADEGPGAFGVTWIAAVPRGEEPDAERLAGALHVGAAGLAILDGAVPARIAVLRQVADRVAAGRRAAAEGAAAAWRALLDAAATMAPGGRAAWVGPRDAEGPPRGFAWTSVPAEELLRLPGESFRFLVLAAPFPSEGRPAVAEELAAVLEHGGIVAMHAAVDMPGPLEGLSIVRADAAGRILRREDR